MVCPTVGVHGGCMVTALAFGSSGQCLSLGQGHFGVFLGNSLYSHSALLRPGLKMGTGECHTGVTLRWTSIPFRGSRNTPSSCIETGDKWQPDEPCMQTFVPTCPSVITCPSISPFMSWSRMSMAITYVQTVLWRSLLWVLYWISSWKNVLRLWQMLLTFPVLHTVRCLSNLMNTTKVNLKQSSVIHNFSNLYFWDSLASVKV